MAKRTIGILAALVVAAGTTVWLAAGATATPRAQGPIKIGISLSLSGDFSDPGKAVKRGYDLWAAYVNAHGGILGRQVQLKIVDDASSPNQVVTNYQNLITRDKVDLAFGPFSSLLTGPAATVANRYHYAFLEPAGGGPKVFALQLHNLFFVQPAPVVKCGDTFVQYLKTLPKAQRPKTASYASLDDPFSSPIADAMRSKFEASGVKTVYKTIYPAETTDLTPIVAKAIAPKPDMIIGGTQSVDAYGQVKALIQAKYNPKFLFFANGANSPTEFPSKVGAKNVNGIFSCSDWTPTAPTSGNNALRRAVHEALRREQVPDRQQLVRGVGRRPAPAARGEEDRLDRQPEDHHDACTRARGRRSRATSPGTPTGRRTATTCSSSGSAGKLLPVFPKSFALAKPFSPKPAWGK